jgi:hypothetical protein
MTATTPPERQSAGVGSSDGIYFSLLAAQFMYAHGCWKGEAQCFAIHAYASRVPYSAHISKMEEQIGSIGLRHNMCTAKDSD